MVETRQEIRIGDTLAELQAGHDVLVRSHGAGKIAFTTVNPYVSHYAERTEPRRSMLFFLSTDDVIRTWVVGATSHVAATLTDRLCP